MKPSTYAAIAVKRINTAKEAGHAFATSEVGGLAIYATNPHTGRIACLYVGTVGGSELAQADDAAALAAMKA